METISLDDQQIQKPEPWDQRRSSASLLIDAAMDDIVVVKQRGILTPLRPRRPINPVTEPDLARLETFRIPGVIRELKSDIEMTLRGSDETVTQNPQETNTQQ